MLQSERQEKVLTHLSHNEYLGLAQAVDMLRASPATINRDFKDLANRKLIERVRGGIRLKSRLNEMLSFAQRKLEFSNEKNHLARKAVSQITPGQVIFIDGGTTTFHMGMYLPDMAVHVITNSLRLASLLEDTAIDQASVEITLTGGYLYKQLGILLGPNTNSCIAQYHADVAFLSIGGIGASGIFNTNELVTEIEKMMIKNSDKTVVLADHSKIGKQSMCHVCDLEQIDLLITDHWPENDPTLDTFQNSGIEIIRIKHNHSDNLQTSQV